MIARTISAGMADLEVAGVVGGRAVGRGRTGGAAVVIVGSGVSCCWGRGVVGGRAAAGRGRTGDAAVVVVAVVVAAVAWTGPHTHPQHSCFSASS